MSSRSQEKPLLCAQYMVLHAIIQLCSVSACCSVWPLSLLAYVATARSLSLPRRRRDYKPCSTTAVHSGNKKPQAEKHVSSGEVGEGECPEAEEGLMLEREVPPSPHLLTRHVKRKKRHELHYLKEVRMVAAVKEECITCISTRK